MVTMANAFGEKNHEVSFEQWGCAMGGCEREKDQLSFLVITTRYLIRKGSGFKTALVTEGAL